MTEREAKARGCRGETVTIWHSNTRDNDKVCARTKKIYGKNFCIVTEKGGEGLFFPLQAMSKTEEGGDRQGTPASRLLRSALARCFEALPAHDIPAARRRRRSWLLVRARVVTYICKVSTEYTSYIVT